jgi:hypothetical protein
LFGWMTIPPKMKPIIWSSHLTAYFSCAYPVSKDDI